MTTAFQWMIDRWLGRWLGPEFYDDWSSKDHKLEQAGKQNLISTVFRWRIDWEKPTRTQIRWLSNSDGWQAGKLTRTRIRWRLDSDASGSDMDSGWACEPNWMTTGFRIVPTWTRIRRLLFKFFNGWFRWPGIADSQAGCQWAGPANWI